MTRYRVTERWLRAVGPWMRVIGPICRYVQPCGRCGKRNMSILRIHDGRARRNVSCVVIHIIDCINREQSAYVRVDMAVCWR